MAEESGELKGRSLTLVGDDGKRTVVTAGGFTLDGGPGRGSILADFGDDGAARLTLYSADGEASAKLRAAEDGTGLSLAAPGRNSALVASGLFVSGDAQKVTLTESGVVVKSLEGEPLLAVPFELAAIKALASELAGGVVSQAKAWLIDKLNPKAAS